MAKIIVSSKHLANQLAKFNDLQYIESVCFIEDIMSIVSGDQSIQVDINQPKLHKIPPFTQIKQGIVRWDWIFKLVSQIDEQPITLDISEERVLITVCY